MAERSLTRSDLSNLWSCFSAFFGSRMVQLAKPLAHLGPRDGLAGVGLSLGGLHFGELLLSQPLLVRFDLKQALEERILKGLEEL